MTSAINRPLAVALFSTFTCLLAAFVGETTLGLGVAVVGTVAFVVTSRRVLLSPSTRPPLLGTPANATDTIATGPECGAGPIPGEGAPAQFVAALLEESPPAAGVALPASAGTVGRSAAALLHPSAAGRALADTTTAALSVSTARGQVGGPPVPPVTAGRSEAEVAALTGAGYFAMTLFQRVASARRALRPLSLVLIEPVGLEGVPADQTAEALTLLGGALRAALRECDIACRYGEAIAAALLEDTSEEGAVQAMTRLHVALADGPQVLRDLSIAVACYPSHALDARTLLERAVEALEFARGSGSGQVEVARAD